MNRIEQLCKQIDICIVSIANHRLCTGNFLRDLGDYIQQHRTEVAKEMAGLKQDVRTAEAAYDLRDAQCKDLLKHNLGLDRARLDAESRLYLMENGKAGAQKITHPTEDNGYGVHLGNDPGSPEGDKTVVSWTCCGKMRSFTPPKNANWTHDAACPDCGSVTKLYVNA